MRNSKHRIERWKNISGLILGLLAVATASGCGGGTPCSVAGNVTFHGEPISQGTIRFFPLGETPGDGAGMKIEQGNYAVPIEGGLMAGEYLIAVSATRDTGRMIAGEGVEGGAAQVPEVVQYIPEAYNVRSSLRAVLKSGENRVDVQIPPAN